MKAITLCCAAALLVVAAAPASAEPVVIGKRIRADDGSVSQVVRFGDLDIRTAAGEKMLVRRVRSAVGAVCDYSAELVETARCKNSTWTEVQPRMQRVLDLARANPNLAVSAMAALTVSAVR